MSLFKIKPVRLAAMSLAALPLGAPACVVIPENFDQPFDIDPPSQLWYLMDGTLVEEPSEWHPEGRDWEARCLDWGGKPVVMDDGTLMCANGDY